ncbi:MAG: helix-turn-helix transcriptional regulator [Candidatus Limnocylindrales bacterium]|jgi:transcriptional regulator with XRE-family HTH domain
MNHATTGPDLRNERLRRGTTQAALAARLGVTPPRLSHVENSVRVTPRFAARYLAALDLPDPADELVELAVRELTAALQAVKSD